MLNKKASREGKTIVKIVNTEETGLTIDDIRNMLEGKTEEIIRLRNEIEQQERNFYNEFYKLKPYIISKGDIISCIYEDKYITGLVNNIGLPFDENTFRITDTLIYLIDIETAEEICISANKIKQLEARDGPPESFYYISDKARGEAFKKYGLHNIDNETLLSCLKRDSFERKEIDRLFGLIKEKDELISQLQKKAKSKKKQKNI